MGDKEEILQPTRQRPPLNSRPLPRTIGDGHHSLLFCQLLLPGTGPIRPALEASAGSGSLAEGAGPLRDLSHSELLSPHPGAHTVPWAYPCGAHELEKVPMLIYAYLTFVDGVF